MFPPQNDPATNVNHQVTVAATTSWTKVTAEVLESNFIQHIFLSAYQSETIDLPPLVRMSSDYSSYILSVNSTWPVTVLASFCSHAICDYTLLHDVSSWGTHYYLITPHFSKQAAVSQMVITSLEDEPSVKIFLSGEMLFRGNVYPEGSFLELHMGALQCLPPERLQSFWFRDKLPKSCCGWFYLLQTHTRGLFVRICSTETSGELEIWLFHPSLSKHRNKFQFPVGNDCSELGSTHHHRQQERERVCLLLVELCYSSFDLTQSISAVRVLVSSFTLDIKTVSLHTNTAAFCWWSLSDCACIWLERENGSVN